MATKKVSRPATKTEKTETATPEGEAFRIELAGGDEQRVPLASLRRDEALSCRAQGINRRTVAEYSEAMQAGATFPPVVVYVDAKGVHWLADGFHRTAAAELAGLADVAADVRQGGRREALLHAANANSAHGLRRTNGDKRRAVGLVLEAFGKWSDRRVAEACGVSDPFVGKLRQLLTVSSSEPREGSDGKVRRAPKVNPEGELAKAGAYLEALVDRLPMEGASRAELRSMLEAWAVRLADAPDVAPVPEVAPAPARRAKGKPGRAATVIAVAS